MRSVRTSKLFPFGLLTLVPIYLALVSCTPAPNASGNSFLLTVIGTNDVHGVFSPTTGKGGLTTISGYVDAVRAAREEDGGDGIFEPVIPEGGFEFGTDKPLSRDVLLQWFRAQDARMNAADFLSDGEPRWNLPKDLPESCTLPILE